MCHGETREVCGPHAVLPWECGRVLRLAPSVLAEATCFYFARRLYSAGLKAFYALTIFLISDVAVLMCLSCCLLGSGQAVCCACSRLHVPDSTMSTPPSRAHPSTYVSLHHRSLSLEKRNEKETEEKKVPLPAAATAVSECHSPTRLPPAQPRHCCSQCKCCL